MKSPNTICPCDSGLPYKNCCQPYHDGLAAPNAEALMRSRYTAYVRNLADYLIQTWHENTRPASLNLTEEPQPKWLGLQIKHVEANTPDTATVEFIARYKINGKAERLHEISQFTKIEDRWYYLEGKFIQNK